MSSDAPELDCQRGDVVPEWHSPGDPLRERIDATLARLAPGEEQLPRRLTRSMRHSLLAPGKRVRARITVLAGLDLGALQEQTLVPGCSIEMVHAASLIIDDLPCMDDAALRRGMATNHRVYGEDTAILAAIGLVSEAFGALAAHHALDPEVRTDLCAALARHVGPLGLVGGQELDLHGDGRGADAARIELIHRRKTAALFACAAWAGARIAGCDASACADLEAFGEHMGLAFQTYDDLADVHAHPELVGKDTGSDGEKLTLVRLLGAAEAMRVADGHFDQALGFLYRVRSGSTRLEHCARALQAQLKARTGSGAGTP